jgi:holin-like protein
VNEMSTKKVYGFMMQAFIFTIIMLVSNLIAAKLPIPMPASVIGMIILFVLLCTKVVKLEQVEDLGMALNAKIGFFFVPAGISVINSLGLMQKYGIQICAVIFAATVILLGVTGLFSDMLLGKSEGKNSINYENVNTNIDKKLPAIQLSHYNTKGEKEVI